MDSKDELHAVIELAPVRKKASSQEGNKVRSITPTRRARRCPVPAQPVEQNASITSLDEYRAARAQPDDGTLQMIDEATRNVHSAASAAMKLITLARNALGLDQLPRP